MSFEKLIKKLSHREWPELRRGWRAAHEEYDDIGKPPPVSVQQLLEYKSSLLIVSGTSKEVTIDLPELRSTAIRESIYLAHKAGALFRSLDRDIGAKDSTYPELTAYTGSLFLAKAICMLFGIWISSKQVNSSQWIVDCFSFDGRGGPSIKAIKLGGKQVGHEEIWSLLQRIFRTIAQSPVDAELIPFITSLEPRDFARLRNRVQYDNCVWLYDDLHANALFDMSWIKPFNKDVYINTSPDDVEAHFGVVVFLMLFRAFKRVLSDLGGGLSCLDAEIDVLTANMLSGEQSVYPETWVNV